MHLVATHIAPTHPVTNVTLNAVDPSRTLSLRNAFARQMGRRFTALARLIRKAIVDDDVFGLGSEVRVTTLQTPGRRTFAFPRDSRKVSAFMEWLRGEVASGVLDVRNISQVGEAVENAWTNQYVMDSYRRGVARARYQMRQSGYNVPPLSATGGVEVSMMSPIHLDRVGLLYTRVFNELQGITTAMDQVISRELAQGLIDGIGTQQLARRLNHVITGQGGDLAIRDRLGRYIPARRRAQLLARTEVIRAHAQGQLQEFKNWGVEGVEIVAEFRTAGDDRVCLQCSSYEGNTYSIEEASSIIPVHPQCRCIWIPRRQPTGTTTAPPPAEEQYDYLKERQWRNVRNSADAARQLQTRLGLQLEGRGTALPVMNKMGEAIGTQTLAKLPKLGKTKIPTWLKFRQSEYVSYRDAEGKLLNNAIGLYTRFVGGQSRISVGRYTYTRLADSIHTGSAAHYTVGGDLASVARHEYGHHVWYKFMTEQQRQEWTTMYDKYTLLFRNQVSQYSAYNVKESWAEAFATYTSPQYDQAAARKSLPPLIRRQLEKVLGKRIDLDPL